MPTASFTISDLYRILVDRAGCDAAELPEDPNATFDELGLDSLAVMDTQLAIEQELGIVLDEQDVGHIRTVGQAIAYVNERLALAVR